MKLNNLLNLLENDDIAQQIPDGADRRAYIALQKEAEDWFAKSRKQKDIKKQHSLDMGNQAKDKAVDILNKHNLIKD
jgi:hypothetical protein